MNYTVLAVMYVVALFAVVIAWLAILVTGPFPRGIFEFLVGVGRWTNRVTAHAFFLVTDEYPLFGLSA